MYLATAQAPIYHMTYFQAVILGIIQGFFELFPLSSLGHTVLIPSWIGGNWATLVRQESEAESPYLAFIVGLHLANAVALLLFYLREWARIISSFFRTLVRRRVETDTERLAWLIVIATVPVGIIGLVFEHEFRVLFAKPEAAAVFLMCNGLILYAGEWYRRRTQGPADAPVAAAPVAAGYPWRLPSPALTSLAPQRTGALGHRHWRHRGHAAIRSRHSGHRGRTEAARGPLLASVTTVWSPSTRTPSTSWPGSGSSIRCGSEPLRHWPCSPASAGKAS